MKSDDSVSYWQSTSQLLPLSTDLPRTVDVAVIGGGLLGAATCYWLTRAGLHVALLERHFPASGATGRNGGFVRAGAAISYPEAIDRFGQETARAVMTLTFQSKALTRQVIEEEGIVCDYQEPGALRLALSQRQTEQLQREVTLLQADGFSAQFLNREQTQALIKTPLASDIAGGRFLPEQGRFFQRTHLPCRLMPLTSCLQRKRPLPEIHPRLAHILFLIALSWRTRPFRQ